MTRSTKDWKWVSGHVVRVAPPPANRVSKCRRHGLQVVGYVTVVRRRAAGASGAASVEVLIESRPYCLRCRYRLKRAWGRLPTNCVVDHPARQHTSKMFARLIKHELHLRGIG